MSFRLGTLSLSLSLSARTAMAWGCCSRRSLAVLLVFSVVPLALLVALERRKFAGESFEYRSVGLVREAAKWDEEGRRFLVSTFFDGSVSEIVTSDGGKLVEKPFIHDSGVAGNGSVGFVLDHPRRRLLVVYGDILGHRYAALGAYDLSSRRRIFLTQLAGAEDEPSLADDVAVDGDGNAYVTDANGNQIWKVAAGGELLATIRSPLFTPSYSTLANLVGLNGIVFHPDGYLLVIHTFAGVLFKIEVATEKVAVVEVTRGSLLLGDGLALLSPTKLVVAAGWPSGRMVESADCWKTAAVTGYYYGPVHRIAAAATVKDGRIFLQHLLGGGLLGGTHVITEAVFPS